MTFLLRSIGVRVALVLGVAWLCAACDVTIGSEGRYVEREKKAFQVTGTPDLTLTTFDGSIEIRSWDQPEVSIEIEKRGHGKPAVDEIQVSATQDGNRVTVDVRLPSRDRPRFSFSRSQSANLIVSVPRQANIDARSGDGAVSIERVSGQVRLATGDGSIKVTEVVGDVRVHTGDGSMAFERLDGRIDAETGDGAIGLSGRLEFVRLHTGDGTVTLRADGGSRMADNWDIHTGDGSVGLELPDPFDADLDVRTSDGSVAINGLAVKGDISRKAVRGQLGGGGRTLRVSTGDGSITLSKTSSE